MTRKELTEAIVSNLLTHKSHLSFSSLMQFADSPKDFIEYKLREKEETDAMIYGTLVHCLILEPDKFNERYVVCNDKDIMVAIGGAKPRATKQYKEWKAIFEQENSDKIIIDSDTYNLAVSTQVNALNNRAFYTKLKGEGENEKKIEWDFLNFKFKGIIDRTTTDFRLDIKTCQNANPKEFQRDIIKRKLYLQAAMYEIGEGIRKPHILLAIDAKGGCSAHVLDGELVNYGIKEYERLVNDFNRCILEDKFNESYEFWSERWDGTYLFDKPTYL